MAQWLRLQLGNGEINGTPLIKAEALLQTRCPVIMSSPPDTSLSRASFYGLGMGISYDPTGRVRFSHSGAFALGAATVVTLLPAESLGVVVLTNGTPVGLPEAVAASFLDLVELGAVKQDWLALYGEVFVQMAKNPSKLAKEQRPSNPGPTRKIVAYVGSYDNNYYGPAQVFDKNGTLTLKIGRQPLEFTLQPWEGDTFAYEPRGENATGISAVIFTVVKDKSVKMTIENLDQTHLGSFIRH
jgi:hypothetical protein